MQKCAGSCLEDGCDEIVKPIMDGMVPQISQTEVMKEIVQTVRVEPETWSSEAKGERTRWRRTESF